VNKIDFRRFALRLLGIIFLVIGLWLLKSLVLEFMVLYTSAQSQRDYKGIWAMAGCALLLIAGGGTLVYNPDLLKE